MIETSQSRGSGRWPSGRLVGARAQSRILFSTAANIAIAAAYFAIAKLGLSMALLTEQVSLVWPATGLSLAVVLLFGYGVWPGIALGAFLANATANEPAATALGIAAGNTLEAVVGSWMLRRAGFDFSLSRLSDVMKLIVLAAGISTAISATIGAMSLCLGNVQPWTAFGSLWWTWWLGDAMGDLIVAPLVLTLAAVRTNWIVGRWSEALALLVGLVATCLIVFTRHWTAHLPGHPLAFAVFPFAIWAALRFGQQGTAVVVVIAGVLAIWGTFQDAQIGSTQTVHERLFVLQVFMGLVAVSTLLLGAAITERRFAVDEAHHERHRLQVILASVADAVMVTDRQGLVTFLNPAAQQLTGWRHEAIGKNLAEVLRIVAEETRGPAEDLLLQVADDGSPRGASREAVLIRRDGAEVPIDATSAPVRHGDHGDVEGGVIVFRDNSERRQAERRKDEFLATLAHELRNPLAPISNALQLLRLTSDVTPAVRHLGEIIERQVKHMVRLIDDLLEISRITRGKFELRKEAVDLVSVIGSAVETSRPHIEAAGHQLAVSLSSEPLTLEADAVRLGQVISNLLNNSAKYTKRGGQIWLASRREGHEAIVSVRDTGVGIAADMLPRVFEMFAQVDSARNRTHGGLGIGLTLAKSLVQMHGGRIEAHSEGPDKGSEFVVRLPLALLTTTAIPTPAASSNSRKSLPAHNIIIVDDAQAAVDTLAELLRALGQRVRTATDALRALELVRAERPDAVISDIAMPKVDGYELARRLRKEPGCDQVVLVALTGYGQDSDKSQAIAAGFDEHLVKPVSLEQLATLLASWPKPAHVAAAASMIASSAEH